MKSSRKLVYAENAQTDLRLVLAYSFATWGGEQGDDYAERFARATQRLLTHPELGRARDDLEPGLRALPVGYHVIFYQVDDRSVTIVRILHAKMDPARHLDPPR
jgi:toxin ParE1/3/4